MVCGAKGPMEGKAGVLEKAQGFFAKDWARCLGAGSAALPFWRRREVVLLYI